MGNHRWESGESWFFFCTRYFSDHFGVLISASCPILGMASCVP